MRYLIFFIIVFLVLRLISYAYLNRPSKRGPRRSRVNPGQDQSSSQKNKKGFEDAEEADYEIIEEK